MSHTPGDVRVRIDLALPSVEAFELAVAETRSALHRLGIRFTPGPEGEVREGDTVVGRVESWRAGERAVIAWRSLAWEEETPETRVELRVESEGDGARVTITHTGWGDVIGEPAEQLGWFASQVGAAFLAAAAPARLGDWITDRWARRPAGASARAVYSDPLYHYPGFHVLLAELRLTPGDYLLEVGCGGGRLLEMALASGCRAAAVDHSHEMVGLARAQNAEAIAQGRLEILESKADALPFPDGVFTCATMAGMFGFLPDPVAALAEIRRTLAPRGRAVVMGSDPELRGTPGAPEPMASRLRFYDDDELEELARAAGFTHVRAVRRDMEAYARRAGVPEEHIPLFSGPGNRFLIAERAAD